MAALWLNQTCRKDLFKERIGNKSQLRQSHLSLVNLKKNSIRSKETLNTFLYLATLRNIEFLTPHKNKLFIAFYNGINLNKIIAAIISSMHNWCMLSFTVQNKHANAKLEHIPFPAHSFSKTTPHAILLLNNLSILPSMS